jgi:translation elongation factor EF-4
MLASTFPCCGSELFFLVANFYLAFAQGLHLLPVVNKVDLPSADPDRALDQMKTNFELDPKTAVLVSAKTGLNVESILPAVIEQTPPYGNRFFSDLSLYPNCSLQAHRITRQSP